MTVDVELNRTSAASDESEKTGNRKIVLTTRWGRMNVEHKETELPPMVAGRTGGEWHAALVDSLVIRNRKVPEAPPKRTDNWNSSQNLLSE